MILSSQAIKDAIKDQSIVIEPFNLSQLGPNSYDLRLADELVTYDEVTLDPRKENRTVNYKISEEGFTLYPGILYLGKTVEYTETHKYVPMLEGRSSLARLGIFIHATGGFGDIGFCGQWTLEISVVQPAIVYPSLRLCQIYFHRVAGAILQKYQGKYQNDREITPSKLYLENR